MQANGAGPGVLAIIGAVTGVVALVWNIWRSASEGARLRVNFYIYEIDDPDDESLAAEISIANAGNLPAYIHKIGLTETLPWAGRWPLIRSASFRTLNRWWLRWAVRGLELPQWRIYTDSDLTGRLNPGEMKEGRLVNMVNGSPETMSAVKVRTRVKQHEWAVVTTGLRWNFARLVDRRRASP